MKKAKIIMAAIMGCMLINCGCAQKKGGKKVNAEEVLKDAKGVFAVLDTSKGQIILNLYYKDVPMTVTNFVGLAEGTLDNTKGKKYYDGLKFHRVISDFMIQGGDPTGTGAGGPGYTFDDEIVENLKFTGPGVLAMANAGTRGGRGTNGSQFFITHKDTPWLNGKHTIFGHIFNDESQDVVDAIEQNDVIKSVKIYRLGEDAQKFTATQADFDNLKKANVEKMRLLKEKALKDKIAEVEKAFPGFNKDENGIYYKILREGNGAPCGSQKNVSTEYRGYFVDGSVFDQSAGRGPLDFTTGVGMMIPGFDIMVQKMKLGEKRTVVLPPDMAYGEAGIPGAIPPNSFLAFDIELVKIK